MTQYHQNKWREEEPLQICYSFWVS